MKKNAKILKNFFLTQMATLVVLKPFRICPRWPLKNPKVGLSTITLYKFFKRKTIAINLLKIGRIMYYRNKIMEKYLIYILAGFLGGIVRDFVGFIKIGRERG